MAESSILPTAAIVFAGGDGTRVGHIAPGIPKCLLPVCSGVTIFDLVLLQLGELGARNILVAGRRHNELIQRSVLGKWPRFKFQFLDEARRGTLNVLRDNLNRLPERALIANADTVYLGVPTIIPNYSRARRGRSFFGVGCATGGKRGNLLCEDGHIYRYDKAGVNSLLSDSGYHILDIRRDASLIARAEGMLEDGFFVDQIRNQTPMWHLPLPYIDLGTEFSLGLARRVLQHQAEVLAEKRNLVSRAGCALQLLRAALSGCESETN